MWKGVINWVCMQNMDQDTQDKGESKLQQNNAIDYQTVIYNTKWKK